MIINLCSHDFSEERDEIVHILAEKKAEAKARKRRESESSFHFYNNDLLQPVNTFLIDTNR